MIITAIKRMTLIALFGGVTIAGMTALATDQQKANELASIEVQRAKTTLQVEQRQAAATMTAIESQEQEDALFAAMQAEKESVKHQAEVRRIQTLAPFWTFASGVLLIGGASGACLLIYIGLDSYVMRREPIISIKGIPVRRRTTSNDVAMLALIRDEQELSANVRMAQARASVNVPSHYAPSVTYAPHLRNTHATQLPADTTPQQPDAAPRVPTFAQLMRAGVIGTGQQSIIYGFDDEQKVYEMSMDKLTSTLIFGNSGSGKTTTLANLIGQLALNNFTLLIGDPHFGHEESLSTRLEPLGVPADTIAQNERDIRLQARYMLATLKQAKTSGEDVRVAWILDEVTAIFRMKCASIVQEALEAIAQEGRKYKIVAYAASQATRANRFGDSSVRDSFPVVVVHRLRRSALRNVGLTSSDEFTRVEKLPVGKFLIDDGKNEPEFLTAPFIEPSDLAQIGQGGSGYLSLPNNGNVTEEAGNVTTTDGSVTNLEAGIKEAEVGTEAGTEVEKVVSLLANGVSQREIIKQVWGVSGGRKYQEAAKEVSQIIANALVGSRVTS